MYEIDPTWSPARQRAWRVANAVMERLAEIRDDGDEPSDACIAECIAYNARREFVQHERIEHAQRAERREFLDALALAGYSHVDTERDALRRFLVDEGLDENKAHPFPDLLLRAWRAAALRGDS